MSLDSGSNSQSFEATRKFMKRTKSKQRKWIVTFIEKASGNSVSGFIASSGKFLRACKSFSKGNFI